MHRILSVFFLVLSMGLAWWALELQSKLLFKEKALVLLRNERDAANTAARQATADAAPLRENIERLQKERDEARTLAENSPTPAAPTADPNAVAFGGLLKQMDSPEMKNMMRSQQLAETRKQYGPLLKRWALSPADADTVLDFLIEKEIGDVSGVFSAINGAPGDLVASMEKKAADTKAHLKTVLGDEKMKELETFEDEIEQTNTVGRYADHLDVSGFPLSAPQRTQLSESIKSESGSPKDKDAAELEEIQMLANGKIDDAALAKLNKREEDKQMRIVQKAKGFLSPDQVSGLQSAFREENQEREAGMKMVGQFMKAGGGAKVDIQAKAPSK